MAYDEGLAERLRECFSGNESVVEKRMFGGIAFMLRGKMCVGIVNDTLMARVGPDQYDDALKQPHLVTSQVMELGDYDDVLRLESAVGRDALVAALREAEPGQFSAPSWTYWHYRLDLARPGRVPPLPKRAIR